MAVDTTPIQTIYNILNQAVSYHPAFTEIFDDFLQEAGDIVTLFSGDASFDFPIFSQHMTWMGSMVTSMESTGNKTRNELPPLQRKQKNSSYGSSHRLTETEVQYDTHFIQTDRTIGMEAKAIGVKLDANGNPMIDPNDPNSFVWDDTSSTGAEIFSKLILSPNRAQLVSAINDGTGNQISGSKIDLSAQGTVLIQAINNRDPSQTTVVIQANKIDLQGVVTSSQMDTRLLNADALFTTSGYASTIYTSGISASTGEITTLTTSSFKLRNSPSETVTVTRKGVKIGNGAVSQTLMLLGTGSDSNLVIPNAVTHFGAASYSGATVSIPYFTFDSGGGTAAGNITFDSTTSLSGGWSGSTYTVTASPQGNTKSVSVSLVIGSTWDYDETLDKYQKTVQIKSGTTVVATDYIDKPDSVISNIAISNPYTTNPTSYDVDGGTLTADRYYVVTATADTGGTKKLKFKTPTGGATGISSMSLSNGYSSEPTADYSGSVSANLWYVVTATPNSGSAKTLKFHVPQTSYNYTPDAIRIGNISYYANTPPAADQNNILNILASSIHANKGKSGYVRFAADLDGYTGTSKKYYIPMSGI